MAAMAEMWTIRHTCCLLIVSTVLYRYPRALLHGLQQCYARSVICLFGYLVIYSLVTRICGLQTLFMCHQT